MWKKFRLAPHLHHDFEALPRRAKCVHHRFITKFGFSAMLNRSGPIYNHAAKLVEVNLRFPRNISATFHKETAVKWPRCATNFSKENHSGFLSNVAISGETASNSSNCLFTSRKPMLRLIPWSPSPISESSPVK